MSEKKRISIDPITRIEGHLRIDCEIENGVVTNAWFIWYHVARYGKYRKRCRPT